MAELPDTGKVNTYEAWLKEEGIPVVRGFFVEDLHTLPVEPWKRKGGLGSYITLDGTSGINDAYVCELPPGASLHPQRHVFEEVIYVLKGRGATSVWTEGRPKQTFEWAEGSMFSIPLNAWHQHFNGDTQAPARYFAVTAAPLVMNLFHSIPFVMDNPYIFGDRFAGQPNYFASEGKALRSGLRVVWETNFVPDVRRFDLADRPDRGAGGRIMHYLLANNTMGAHCSEFPLGTYKKAHRHGPGAHVVVLGGRGYSLLWKAGEPIKKLDWKPGCLFVPPDQWFHQHFNSGTTPARYMAVHFAGQRYSISELLWPDKANVSLKEGGAQIEYADEDPEIGRLFEAELAKVGAVSRMAAVTGKA